MPDTCPPCPSPPRAIVTRKPARVKPDVAPTTNGASTDNHPPHQAQEEHFFSSETYNAHFGPEYDLGPIEREPLPKSVYFPTEPAPTEATPTEPAPTEPAPTEPAPTEPAANTSPAEPSPAEPAPTEPAPSEPAAVGDYDRLLAEGDGLSKRARYRQAAGSYESAIVANPRGDAALSALSMCYLNMNRMDDALTMATRATEANPNNAQGWLVRGFVLQTKRRRDEARAAYQKCIEVGGTSPSVRECRVALRGV